MEMGTILNREEVEELIADPKASKCLEAFRKLPARKQDELLMLMEAFLMGANTVKETA